MDDMLQETGHAAEVRTKEVSWHSFGTNFLTRVKKNLLVAEAWLPDLSALSSQPPFHLGLKHPPRLSPAHLTGIQAKVGFHSSLVARSLSFLFPLPLGLELTCNLPLPSLQTFPSLERQGLPIVGQTVAGHYYSPQAIKSKRQLLSSAAP